MTHDSSDIGTIVHLPECPAPLCDWGLPDGECMGYEDCHHLCCCGALRACEQRIKQSITGLSWYSKARWTGYYEGIAAAREAVARQCGHTKSVSTDYLCDHDRAVDAIDALRNESSRD